MNATISSTPRDLAAEFAAIMAEQADLTRRAFRLFEDACRARAIDDGQRQRTLRPLAAQPETPAAPEDAAQIVIAGPIPVSVPKPEPVAPASIAKEEPRIELAKPGPTAPAPAVKSRRDLVLDLFASTTMTTTEMAEHLGLGQSTVAGTIVGSRKGSDPRIARGDAARLALRQAANPERAPTPRPSVIPPLAPIPRAAPKPVAAQPIAGIAPLPAVKTPAEAKARADARMKVLRHYGETGDYEAAIAKKLGLLRAWVVWFIHEAREAKDPRVTVGDGRRRLREKR